MFCMSFQQWIDIFQLLATIMLGGFAGWIAFQQHWTNRNKLRLELFDRRLAVYSTVRDTLSNFLKNGDISINEYLSARAEIAEAEFLFGKDVIDYLNTLFERFNTLMLRKNRIAADRFASAEARNNELNAELQDSNWISEQTGTIKQVFAPYLGFSDIKRSRKFSS